MFWCDALSAPAAAARRGPPRGHRPPALHGCGARAPPSRPPARRRLPKLKSPPDAQATGRRAAPRVLTYSSAPVHAGVSARSAGAHVLLVLPLAALLVRPTISQAGASGMSWPSSASQSSTAAPASTSCGRGRVRLGCTEYIHVVRTQVLLAGRQWVVSSPASGCEERRSDYMHWCCCQQKGHLRCPHRASLCAPWCPALLRLGAHSR